MTAYPPFDQRTVIIAEADPVVSMDLAELLMAAYPFKSIRPSRELPLAVSSALVSPSDTVFLVNSSFLSDQISVNEISDLTARGAQVVVIGEPRDYGFECVYVTKPFTTEMVLSALSR